MTIDLKREDGALTGRLEGRLDTATSPELEKTLDSALDGVKDLVFDLTGLTYTSSAGLRVLKKLYIKVRGKGGSLVLTNLPPYVEEVLEMTGFAEMFEIR